MAARSTSSLSVQDLLEQYEQGLDVTFPTTPRAAYERRLIFDHVVEPPASTLRQRYEAIASALRDLLSQRWLTMASQAVGGVVRRQRALSAGSRSDTASRERQNEGRGS
jgi:hypothetical protein